MGRLGGPTDGPPRRPIRRPSIAGPLHALTRRTSPSVKPTGGRRMGGIVAIEEVVAGQVLKGRRTSLRAGSASQVFARSRTASEDEDAGHRPEGSASVGHAFKIGGRAKARRRVRFPSASATNSSSDQSLREEAGVGGRGKGLDRSSGDRVYHTSLSVFASRDTGRVFRPPAGRPDKSSAGRQRDASTFLEPAVTVGAVVQNGNHLRARLS